MKFLGSIGLEALVKNIKALFVPVVRTVNGKALDTDITLVASDVGADASGSASSALSEAIIYTDNAVAQKTQVQIITWEADD